MTISNWRIRFIDHNQFNMGWLSSVEHTFEHGAHEVAHEAGKGWHKVKHSTKHAEHALQRAGHRVVQSGHHAASAVEHAADHFAGSAADRVKDTFHGLSSLEKSGWHGIEDATASIEHGAASAIGMAESTAMDVIHAGKRAAGTSAAWLENEGQDLWGNIRHDAGALIDYEKEAWGFAKHEMEGLWGDAESGFSWLWDLIDPFEWSWGEWILIGGGGALGVYMLLRGGRAAGRYAVEGGQAAYRGAKVAAPYAAEAAPLLLL